MSPAAYLRIYPCDAYVARVAVDLVRQMLRDGAVSYSAFCVGGELPPGFDLVIAAALERSMLALDSFDFDFQQRVYEVSHFPS